MSKDLDDVVKGEDISCPNFFKLKKMPVYRCRMGQFYCNVSASQFNSKKCAIEPGLAGLKLSSIPAMAI